MRREDVIKYKVSNGKVHEQVDTRRTSMRTRFFTYGQETAEGDHLHPFRNVQAKGGKKIVKKRHDVLSKKEVDAIINNAIHEKARRYLALMYFSR